MTKPTECKWCGCDKVWLSRGTVIVFDCGSSWSANDGLEISTECRTRCSDLVIQQRDRIQRAVDKLKAAKRYTVSPGPRNTLNWDPDPDGYVTDSPAVDEALAILEGEREGEEKQDE